MDLELDGRRALVTGGTKGIGKAVAVRLREAGATVLATARHLTGNAADGEHFVAADVSTAEGCVAVAEAVRSRLGGIDIIVHVVGGRRRRRAVMRCWAITNGIAPSSGAPAYSRHIVVTALRQLAFCFKVFTAPSVSRHAPPLISRGMSRNRER